MNKEVQYRPRGVNSIIFILQIKLKLSLKLFANNEETRFISIANFHIIKLSVKKLIFHHLWQLIGTFSFKFNSSVCRDWEGEKTHASSHTREGGGGVVEEICLSSYFARRVIEMKSEWTKVWEKVADRWWTHTCYSMLAGFVLQFFI